MSGKVVMKSKLCMKVCFLFDFWKCIRVVIYAKIRRVIGQCIFVLLPVSMTVSAWDCSVCGQHYESDGALPHNCQPDYSKPAALDDLLLRSGFAHKPSSSENARAVFAKYLAYLPLYNQKPDLPWDVTQWLYHWFTHLGLCEHGSGVGGSWVTEQGASCCNGIQTHGSKPETSISRLRELLISLKTWCLHNACGWCYGSPEEYSEVSGSFGFGEWYLGQAGMCGCGNPDEVYKLLYESINFFKEHQKKTKLYNEFPIENSQIKKCFISWLIHQGLINQQLTITEKGKQVLSLLEPGYPDYDEDPCD